LNESDSSVATNQRVYVIIPLAKSAGNEKKVKIPDEKEDTILEIQVSYIKPEKSEKEFNFNNKSG